MGTQPAPERVSDLLRVPIGGLDLDQVDPRATPGFRGGKGAGRKALERLGPVLSDPQERLYAEGRTGGRRSVLLVLQGMDTSGKGGTVKHVVRAVDPQGVTVKAFRAPTPEEQKHDFLWRVRRALPAPGYLGVFDRSHYEDVLVARVERLVDPETWMLRYPAINRFEEELVAGGTTVVKCFLHISRHEQKQRMLRRLEREDKRWKFDPHDVDARDRWDDYQAAYADVLRRCSTETAPWYVVPADRKWYRNWAVMNILIAALDALDLRWPQPGFDVEEQRQRLLASD